MFVALSLALFVVFWATLIGSTIYVFRRPKASITVQHGDHQIELCVTLRSAVLSVDGEVVAQQTGAVGLVGAQLSAQLDPLTAVHARVRPDDATRLPVPTLEVHDQLVALDMAPEAASALDALNAATAYLDQDPQVARSRATIQRRILRLARQIGAAASDAHGEPALAPDLAAGSMRELLALSRSIEDLGDAPVRADDDATRKALMVLSSRAEVERARR